ncbi:MAG: IS3 family transposase [Planctomycetota bacterium]
MIQPTSRVFDYIELFYNATRLHSKLGCVSPLECEYGFGRTQSLSSQAPPR